LEFLTGKYPPNYPAERNGKFVLGTHDAQHTMTDDYGQIP